VGTIPLRPIGRSHAAKDLEILKENPRWATSASEGAEKVFDNKPESVTAAA
jgi:hypothetical protein